MRIVFIGAVNFSKRVLEQLLTLQADIVGVGTLPVPISDKSDRVDLHAFAAQYSKPCFYAHEINSTFATEWIAEKNPDLIFCIGWPNLLKESLLSLPKMGVIGYHPTQLPRHRGRHPIIWTLALGLEHTASTFFFMNEYPDAGDIISQLNVDVDVSDDAGTLYERLVEAALSQIRYFFPKLEKNEISLVSQDEKLATSWRKRTVMDGCIDWRMSANSVYNLIRALTKPYPGAHFNYKGSSIKVWRSAVVKNLNMDIEPGKVIAKYDGLAVIKCGQDSIYLLDYEPSLKFSPGEYL